MKRTTNRVNKGDQEMKPNKEHEKRSKNNETRKWQEPESRKKGGVKQ